MRLLRALPPLRTAGRAAPQRTIAGHHAEARTRGGATAGALRPQGYIIARRPPPGLRGTARGVQAERRAALQRRRSDGMDSRRRPRLCQCLLGERWLGHCRRRTSTGWRAQGARPGPIPRSLCQSPPFSPPLGGRLSVGAPGSRPAVQPMESFAEAEAASRHFPKCCCIQITAS